MVRVSFEVRRGAPLAKATADVLLLFFITDWQLRRRSELPGCRGNLMREWKLTLLIMKITRICFSSKEKLHLKQDKLILQGGWGGWSNQSHSHNWERRARNVHVRTQSGEEASLKFLGCCDVNLAGICLPLTSPHETPLPPADAFFNFS